MRYRFTGAVVAMTLAAAVSLTVAPTAQQGRGNAPAAPAAGQGRGAAARPAQIAGHPNLNGVWQAIGSAHWNLEDHSASAAGPAKATKFVRTAALAAAGGDRAAFEELIASRQK